MQSTLDTMWALWYRGSGENGRGDEDAVAVQDEEAPLPEPDPPRPKRRRALLGGNWRRRFRWRRRSRPADAMRRNDPDGPRTLMECCKRVAYTVSVRGGIALLILFCIGLISDHEIWDFAPNYYAWSVVAFGAGGVALFAARVAVEELSERPNRLAIFGFVAYACLFATTHAYIGSYLGTLQAATNDEFFTNELVHELMSGGGAFNVDAPHADLECDPEEMLSQEVFWAWLRGPVAENLFCTYSAQQQNASGAATCGIVDGKLIVAGSFLLRTQRAMAQQCSAGSLLTNGYDVCVPELDDDSEDTQPWALPELDLDQFCPGGIARKVSDDENRSDGALRWRDSRYVSVSGRMRFGRPSVGVAGTYHRGGYALVLDPRAAAAGAPNALQECLHHLQEASFVDRQTRMTSLEVIFEAPDLGDWHAAQAQLEWLPSGNNVARLFQQHGALDARPPSEFLTGFPQGPLAWCPGGPASCSNETHVSAKTQLQPFVRTDLPLALALYAGFGTFQALDLSLALRDEGARYFVSRGWNAFRVVVLGLLVSGFALEVHAQAVTPRVSLLSSSSSGNTDFNSAPPPAWYDYTWARRQQEQVLAFLVLLVWVQALQFLAMSTWSRVLAKTLVRSVKDVAVFTLLFGVILIGFAACFYVLYGRVDEQFSTTWKAFFAMVRGLTGDLESAGLFAYEPIVTFFVYTAYIFFTVFVVLTMLVAIINEHFVHSLAAIATESRRNARSDRHHRDKSGSRRSKRRKRKRRRQGQQQLSSSGSSVDNGDSGSDSDSDDDDDAGAALEEWLRAVPEGHVRLCLIRAAELARAEKSEIQAGVDAYAKACLVSRDGTPRRGAHTSGATQTAFATLEPRWLRRLELKPRSLADAVRVVVYDRDPVDVDRYLGEAQVVLRELPQDAEPQGLELPLMDYRSVPRKVVSRYTVDGYVEILAAFRRGDGVVI